MPALIERPAPWVTQAACRHPGVDPDLFFPVTTRATRQIRAAQEVCKTCPVAGHCLDYALRNKEQHGIWGGVLFLKPSHASEIPETRTIACDTCGDEFERASNRIRDRNHCPRCRHGRHRGAA